MLEVYNYITANTIIPSALELIEKGWVPLLKTGVVSVATTGQLVWNTGSAGQKLVTEDNSGGIKADTSYLSYIRYGVMEPRVEEQPAWTATEVANLRRRLKVIPFTSNVGGTLDADQNLVATKVGYYGVFRILGIWSDGAETPTWELEDDDGALVSLTTPAHVAGQQMDSLAGYVLWGGTDAKNLYIDTTSANLGNAVSYRWLIEYWYET